MSCLLRCTLLGGLAVAAVAAELPLAESDWTFVGGAWKVAGETLVQENPEHLNQAFFHAQGYASPDLTVRFRIRNEGKGVQAAGLILCSADSRSGYRVHFDRRNRQVILSRVDGPDRRELARRRNIPLANDHWHEARARVAGGTLEVFLDGEPVLAVGEQTLDRGLGGVYTSQGAVEFSRITVNGEPTDPADWRVRQTWEVPPEQHGARIMETKVIAKQPGRYIGWPTVCRRRNGELLVVFSGDRDEHVCPWGKVQMVRSSDDGETWSAPASICNTPLDDRDAGVIETSQGTLVVNWFTSLAFESYGRRRLQQGSEVHRQWLYHAEKLTPDIRRQWLGCWMRRSEDGGATWGEPIRHTATTPHGPIELADGRLLLVGRRNDPNGAKMVVEQSTDDARSWQGLAIIPHFPEDDPNQYHEPHLAEAADGTLVAMFRYHFRVPGKSGYDNLQSYLRQAESQDGGKTWTAARPTPLLGYPPHLLRLRDGRLLCVWGRRTPPYGEYACLSDDNGKTWNVEQQIHLAAAANSDLGYPASTELPDGRILTVYYQIDQPGERTSLMGTFWRPPPK